MMYKTLMIAGFLASALTFGTTRAEAASLTFDSWVTTTDNPVIDTAPSITVDDTSNANALTFNVTIPNANGELSGIWLDFGGGFTWASTDLMSLTGGVSIDDFTTALGADSNDIGNGRNLSGGFGPPINGGSGTFDFGFGFDDGDSGGNARRIALPFSFKLDDQAGAVELADIARIGLRFQSVGTQGQNGLGDGSEKLIGFPPDVTTVPLPAGLPLLIAGLGVMAVLRARKA